MVIVPAKSGVMTVVPGLVLNNGASVRAYTSHTNAVTVFGSVRRYEQDGR